jgi:invasion protein IalB
MAIGMSEMYIKTIKNLFAALALTATAVALSTQAVWAQDSSSAALGSAERPIWLKVCNKDPRLNKNVCLITQELRASTGQTLTSVAIREIEGTSSSLLVSVPLGTLIESGVAVQIDKGQSINLPLRICLPRACYAEFAIKSSLINAMKAGGQLIIQARNQQGKAYKFELSLTGFTASYTGDPIDPQQLQDSQQKLQDELQKKIQESKQKLIDQQNKQVDSDG